MSKLLQILIEKNVDAIWLTDVNYRRFATGFQSSFGVFVLTKTEQYFFTDRRYSVAAKQKCKNITVQVVHSLQEVYTFLVERNLQKLALPLDFTTARELENLRQKQFTIYDCSRELVELVAVKQTKELKAIKNACAIAEKSYLEVLPTLKAGVTELEIAGLLEYHMRKFGAENRAFDSIVAFGANSAVPHHTSSNCKLQKGMPVLLDFGAIVDGYCSDMTRSFLFQPEENAFSDFYLKMHKLVCLAHNKAKQAVQIGSRGADIDKIARAVFAEYAINVKALKSLNHLNREQDRQKISFKSMLERLVEGRKLQKGYCNLADFFTHSLGHGLGIFIHQSPTLSKNSQDILAENIVFTIEPGLYFEGLFGIRIEDTLYLRNRAISYMRTEKNMSILQ